MNFPSRFIHVFYTNRTTEGVPKTLPKKDVLTKDLFQRQMFFLETYVAEVNANAKRRN